MLEKLLKNPLIIISIITFFAFIPLLAFLFDRVLLNLSYSALFYIEIFAGIMFLGIGFFIAYVFLKMK